ncbi:MAG: O-antigen ligase family protein [bacterium]|nr:O-antigen ligase family protein [bacterium]
MLTKVLIALLFITFPLGQVVRWEFLGGQVVLRPNDLVACMLGFMGLLKLQGSTLQRPLILWYLAMILSLALNIFNYTPTQLLISSSYIIRFILYSGLYFIFKDFKLNKNYLVIVCLLIAVFGFGQYWFIPDTRFLKDFGWDDHYYRLISTFLDPGFTGTILLLGLLLTKNKIIKIILYLAMALTYSRATFLMFIVSYAVVAWYQKSIKIFLTACLIMALTLIFLPRTFGEGTKLSRETSFWGRINNWKMTVLEWRKAPVFGLGFGGYRYATNAPQSSHAGAGADSSLLLVLATTGIVGLFAYLNLLRAIWINNKNYLFRASFIGIIIASFFNNTLFYPFVMEWLWILFALPF